MCMCVCVGVYVTMCVCVLTNPRTQANRNAKTNVQKAEGSEGQETTEEEGCEEKTK